MGKKRGRNSLSTMDDWSDDDANEAKNEEQMRLDRIRRRAMAMDDSDDESSSSEEEEEATNDPYLERIRRRAMVTESDDEESDGVSDGKSERESSEEEEEESSEEEEDKPDPEEEKLTKLRESIRQLSFGQLQKLRKTGIDGKPVHKALGFQSIAELNAWIAGDDSVLLAKPDKTDSHYHRQQKERKPKGKERKPKRHKSAPIELPSNKQVRRYREIIQVPNRESRDPRFESLSGHLNTDSFNKSYAFLAEMRDEEIERMSNSLQRDRTMRAKGKRRFKGKLSAEEATKIQADLTRLQQQRAKDTRADELQKLKSARMKEERAKVASGQKRAFYLKKSEVKKLELEHKYNKLKESGKLNKYLAKRRKKNAAKDHRFVPSQRLSKEDSD